LISVSTHYLSPIAGCNNTVTLQYCYDEKLNECRLFLYASPHRGIYRTLSQLHIHSLIYLYLLLSTHLIMHNPTLYIGDGCQRSCYTDTSPSQSCISFYYYRKGNFAFALVLFWNWRQKTFNVGSFKEPTWISSQHKI